jgi:hypothetical protein
MDAPIERLIVTRFDLALGLNLLKGHRPLPALGKNRDAAGALADAQIYQAVVQGEPFTLSAPRKVRFVPAGWVHHESKFWRGFNKSFIAQEAPQVAQALPIRAKIITPEPQTGAEPNAVMPGPADSARPPVVSAWFWPFAVATQLAIDSRQTIELADAGKQARQILDGATWSAAGIPPASRSALFKAHRACMLETLFPKDTRPSVNVRVDDFTITTLLAAPGTARSAFNKWTLRDRALAYGAMMGADVSTDDARTMAVTVADLKLDSFALFSFRENGGRALLYLTQHDEPKEPHWAWCLTMNVAHFVMTSLALACLAEDLRNDSGRTAQRAAAIAALGALRTCYRVRTDGRSITERLYQNHAWIARAMGQSAATAPRE